MESRQQKRFGTWRDAFVVSLALVGASCSGTCSRPSSLAETAAPAGSGVDAAAVQTAGFVPDVKVADLGRLADLIAAGARELTRTDFDPATMAAVQGKDPEQLFGWVRDNTWWVPYRGVLRGSRGVLLDRVGNSLDRAILLGDLLRRAGHQVRLAHARLPDDRARELFKNVQPPPDRKRDGAEASSTSADHRRVLESILPGFDAAMKTQRAAARQSEVDAANMVRSQADQLMATLRDAAMNAPSVDEQMMASLQDHWWVERQEQGQWIAFDLFSARTGQSITTASETHRWTSSADLPDLPADLWHTVQIRVVIERYQAGARSEASVLEQTLRPLDVLEKPISLFHIPRPWPERRARTKESLAEAADQVTTWVPVLRVGNDSTVKSGFTNAGEVRSNPLDPSVSGGTAAFDAFGGALGGDDEGIVTAEWIDYEVRTPGAPVQTIRRQVFDILGPARRAAKDATFDPTPAKLERAAALLSTTNILLQPCEFTDAFAAHLVSATVIKHQSDFKRLAAEQDRDKARILARAILEDTELWSPLLELVLLRTSLAPAARDSFIGRPNILNHRSSPILSGPDKGQQAELVDIASNNLGVRYGAARPAFQIRLEQGVADTVAEMLALGSDVRAAANTASVFSSRPPGDTSRTIRPGDAASAGTMGWPADAAARLASHVHEGFLVVALNRPVQVLGRGRLGWWRIDPKSGDTIGVMDTGFNQDMPEQSKVRAAIEKMQEWLESNTITNMPPGSTVRNAIQLQEKRAEIIGLIRRAAEVGIY